jgi:hypothetical protein
MAHCSTYYKLRHSGVMGEYIHALSLLGRQRATHDFLDQLDMLLLFLLNA